MKRLETESGWLRLLKSIANGPEIVHVIDASAEATFLECRGLIRRIVSFDPFHFERITGRWPNHDERPRSECYCATEAGLELLDRSMLDEGS